MVQVPKVLIPRIVFLEQIIQFCNNPFCTGRLYNHFPVTIRCVKRSCYPLFKIESIIWKYCSVVHCCRFDPFFWKWSHNSILPCSHRWMNLPNSASNHALKYPETLFGQKLLSITGAKKEKAATSFICKLSQTWPNVANFFTTTISLSCLVYQIHKNAPWWGGSSTPKPHLCITDQLAGGGNLTAKQREGHMNILVTSPMWLQCDLEVVWRCPGDALVFGYGRSYSNTMKRTDYLLCQIPVYAVHFQIFKHIILNVKTLKIK